MKVRFLKCWTFLSQITWRCPHKIHDPAYIFIWTEWDITTEQNEAKLQTSDGLTCGLWCILDATVPSVGFNSVTGQPWLIWLNPKHGVSKTQAPTDISTFQTTSSNCVCVRPWVHEYVSFSLPLLWAEPFPPLCLCVCVCSKCNVSEWKKTADEYNSSTLRRKCCDIGKAA